MEKMTIHRALTELKNLNERIEKATNSATYVKANKKSNTKIDGSTLEDYEKSIVASYDKVVGLINRRNAIKSAIVDSNSKVEVEIAGNRMTVAEAIERKVSIHFDGNLISAMKRELRTELSKLNKENEELPRKLEAYLTVTLGSKDQHKQSDVEAHTESFMQRNTYELVDPIGIKEKIEKLEDQINGFMVEVDSVLSESNAVTFIEI